jgi:hypothetical protein
VFGDQRLREFDERYDFKARWSSIRGMRQGEYEKWKDERRGTLEVGRSKGRGCKVSVKLARTRGRRLWSWAV